jgi:hypothetical protein
LIVKSHSQNSLKENLSLCCMKNSLL